MVYIFHSFSEIQKSMFFHFHQMQSLLESGQFSDVTLVVGPLEQKEKQEEFKVHRNLLSAFSPVFSAMFSHSDTKEALEKRVLIEDVSAETMHRLLSFIYTSNVDFEKKEKTLLELLSASDKYQVDFLKNRVESLLADLVAVDSVLSLLQYADLHSASILKEKCFRFIVANSGQIIFCDNELWPQFEATAHSALFWELLCRLAAKQIEPHRFFPNTQEYGRARLS